MNFKLSLPVALALATFAICPSPARAQQLDLPRPSPFAKVVQTVGLTDITVDYSSPGVKGRKIWGGVVPLDQVWRTGANSATKVTFSKDVTVGTTKVPAGSYSLFTIPGADAWTVILNKNATASTREYKQAEDLVRVTGVKPVAIPLRERLAFTVADFSDNTANIDMEWEKVRVSLPVKLATDEQTAANIKGMTDGAWRPWNAAARYQFETKKDYDQALALVDRSLSLKEDWFNVWTKAQVLAAKGKTKEAHALAEKAKALGDKGPEGTFFYADDVKKAIAEWKK